MGGLLSDIPSMHILPLFGSVDMGTSVCEVAEA